MQERKGVKGGRDRAAGGRILPAVGLVLLLLSGCRFGAPAPPPAGGTGLPSAGEGAAAAPSEIDPAEAARLAETPDGRRLAEARNSGSADEAIPILFAISPDAPEAILRDGAEVAQGLARSLGLADLRRWVTEVPRHPTFLPVFQVELASRRYLAGDLDESRTFAEAALALAPTGAVAERARSLIEGRGDEGVRTAASIGVVLSTSGSPAFQQISAELREGIEVALALEERVSGVPIRLVTVDDGGSVAGVEAAMATLRAQSIAGIVGPIYDPVVAAAAGLRGSQAPILSPSARVLPDGASGVLSLSGVDPAAGRALADLVMDRGIREVVVLRQESPQMREEALRFREAYQTLGGTVQRELSYPPGATGFAEVVAQIVALAPRGLVLLLPPGGGEIAQLASQLTFYGLGNVPNLVRFGNDSWTTANALEGIEPRHLNGIFAVSRTTVAGELGPGWEEFEEAYEDHFHRSLRTSAPAFGFDAARLILRAARTGGGDPAQTLEALMTVEGYPGATGTLSLVDGRIEREYYPVRIENRTLVPLPR